MSRDGNKRPQRVGQLMQQELGKLLQDGLRDPRVGFVTVTEVRVARDLRHARVYVSVYGEQEQREESLAGLNRAAGFIKRELGHRLDLRFVPELEFELDETLDRAERLDDVLRAISEGAEEAPDARKHEVLPVENDRTSMRDKALELEASRAVQQKEKSRDKGRKRSARSGRGRGPGRSR